MLFPHANVRLTHTRGCLWSSTAAELLCKFACTPGLSRFSNALGNTTRKLRLFFPFPVKRCQIWAIHNTQPNRCISFFFFPDRAGVALERCSAPRYRSYRLSPNKLLVQFITNPLTIHYNFCADARWTDYMNGSCHIALWTSESGDPVEVEFAVLEGALIHSFCVWTYFGFNCSSSYFPCDNVNACKHFFIMIRLQARTDVKDQCNENSRFL